MATITLQRLKQIIADAYSAGYGGSLELLNEYVEGSISSLINEPSHGINENDGWRKYTINELRALPIGTIIEHYSKGKGWIEKIRDNTRTHLAVRFENGDTSFFRIEDAPWDEPIRIIGNVAKPKPKVTRSNLRSGIQTNNQFGFLDEFN